MEARKSCFLVLFAVCVARSLAGVSDCDEVRKVFQERQIGTVKSVPERPRKGSDLQVCGSRNLTCCNKKMEERYQLAARRDIQSLVQRTSSSLKFLISRNVATFQEVFENLVKQAENYTSTLFTSAYRSLAPDAGGPVRQLFGDISLLALGSELEVEDVVRSFFEQLFPVVYRHVIDPDATAFGEDFAECLRVAGNRLGPFGGLPKQLARRLGRSVPPAQVFLQALHLGIEVINTTDHLQYTKECRRALLKMLYCPHCQGLTRSKPCTGYCLNVMRGCLASVAEVDAHWREFVRSLEDVSAGMQEHLDLEQALFGVRPLVAEALAHAQNNGPKLSAQVSKLCGRPSRVPARSVGSPRDTSQNSIPLKAPERSAEETFSSRRREFINSLRLHRTFYGGLADQLCVGEVASEDGLSCWNGADVTKSYTLRVVGSGIDAQSGNPDVKVKGLDPVINQIIDKLKHINQLLQGKQIPKYGTLDQIETGSGDGEGHFSGDCDDEDGCAGSGSGEAKRAAKIPYDFTDYKHQTLWKRVHFTDICLVAV
uniref:Glypican 5a n=1 Tax=Scleropages formosus TaxID=113540 RepID=A0A8C9UZD5_SCLFO